MREWDADAATRSNLKRKQKQKITAWQTALHFFDSFFVYRVLFVRDDDAYDKSFERMGA